MKRIVITGGGGYLAGHLFQHLTMRGGYDIVLVGRSPRQDKALLVADISEWCDDWAGTFENAHAIVHLAAERAWDASWNDLKRTNIDGVLNVFEAAALKRARRVIAASSSRVLEGYFRSGERMTPTLPPKPECPYSISRMAGESIARHYALRRGVSVVCFRIGCCHAGDQQPDARMPLGQQLRWLSPRDFCQAMERAIEADNIDFSLLHLSSAIDHSPWDISDTRQVLGFTPQDHYQPQSPSLTGKAKRAIKRTILQIKRKRVH